PHLKIIMLSSGGNPDVMAHLLLSGADDLLSKPFSLIQLQTRVKAALRLKRAQDQADSLNRHLLTMNLEQGLGVHSQALAEERDMFASLLAKALERRGVAAVAHAARMPQYC